MNFKNARPMGTPEGRRNPISAPQFGIPGKAKMSEARINLGMITTIDPADIQPGALQKALNVRVRYDRVQRRPGSLAHSPSKPNSNQIVALGYHKTNADVKYITRFCAAGIHYEASGSWTALSAGSGGSLTGTALDRFRAVTAFNRYVFTNNGKDVIQEIDFGANTYKALGNDSPKYKYITGFANRIVGANYTGATADPTQVGWSADGNIDEWNPATDESAGFSPLIDSPSDRADFLTGIFGYTNVMVLLREQSLWVATKQPIAQNPFYFYTAFAGLGCDTPDSAVSTLGGVTFMDTRSQSIWFFAPGQSPEPIGRPIEKDIFRGLTDTRSVFASFNPIEHEYTICVPILGQLTEWMKLWTYNFRTQSWVYDERQGISSLNDIDYSIATTTIDDLGEIPIDQLPGTIDDLSPVVPNVPTRFFGRIDGEILQEDADTDSDPFYTSSFGPILIPPPPGVGWPTAHFNSELISKSFEIPTDDMYVCEINLELMPRAEGTISIEYSKDGGVTFVTGKSMTIDANNVNKPTQFRLVKQIRCRKFAWKMISYDGQWELIRYTVYVYKGPESAE